MTDKSNRGKEPAFGHGDHNNGGDPGMTIREYYAGQIASALAVGNAGPLGGEFSAYAKGFCNKTIADRAVALADELIKALEAPND